MQTRQEAIQYCHSFKDVYEDYPFHDDNWCVMRHKKNKKTYAVIAYYCEGASQAEIAKNLEISQQAASGLIQRALVIIRNYMQVNPSDVKRKRNKK